MIRTQNASLRNNDFTNFDGIRNVSAKFVNHYTTSSPFRDQLQYNIKKHSQLPAILLPYLLGVLSNLPLRRRF